MGTIMLSRSGWRGYKCEHLAEQKGESKLTIIDVGFLIHLSDLMKYWQVLGSLFSNNDQLAVHYTAHYITK